ncbi:MAG TPA: FAD-dependent oxidoreductase, partial [Sporichthyaceae bacterium]
MSVHRPRIAVVGAGISGLSAAWVLQRAADVTLYEADDRLGGHAHTHDVARLSGAPLAVDSGFIVHNEKTYPTLLRLFAALGVATTASDMSMSVRCDGCGLEYAGSRGLRGLFPAADNLRRPAYLR